MRTSPFLPELRITTHYKLYSIRIAYVVVILLCYVELKYYSLEMYILCDSNACVHILMMCSTD